MEERHKDRDQRKRQEDKRSRKQGGGKPSFPSPSAGDLRELPRVPLRGEGCCGVGGPSRDSSGFGAIEEGLISRGDTQRKRASPRGEAGTSGFLCVSDSDRC